MTPAVLKPPSSYLELAKKLPPPLLRFLARWPPASIHANPDKPILTSYQQQRPDPFRPFKHPATGCWHDAVYSRRKQADLMRLAQKHGVAELMPVSQKDPERRLAKRVEFGLRVKGTGVGQQVKGHAHERTMIARHEKRRKAMLAMPKLIKQFKKVGKRRWKKFPKL
ncbi:hypothetical protein CDD82_5251 [Ophiocordyceps australis]|uniref:Large ribosomal subunit protein mL59 domain-containing protein n=1 Tax=Ophiocordyceps australis TaxID=1399860 RepID=A0A2C5Z1W3_9HYPO|nr:hypothetical protein CDD82_5251 [Ophiocordyceps australis]